MSLNAPQVILLNGGLGNQFFQYVFGMYLQAKFNSPVLFDDRRLIAPSTQHQRTHHEGLRSTRLKSVFGISYESLWSGIDIMQEELEFDLHWSKSIPQRMHQLFGQFSVISETSDHSFLKAKPFDSRVLSDKKISLIPTYWHGYWITHKFYRSISTRLDIFKKLLLNSDCYETNRVAVHARNFKLEGFDWTVPDQYYRDAFNQMSMAIGDESITFALFSDDMPWVAERSLRWVDNSDFNIVLSESVNDVSDLKELCAHQNIIMGNSSFAYMAALLRPLSGLTIGVPGRNV